MTNPNSNQARRSLANPQTNARKREACLCLFLERLVLPALEALTSNHTFLSIPGGRCCDRDIFWKSCNQLLSSISRSGSDICRSVLNKAFCNKRSSFHQLS